MPPVNAEFLAHPQYGRVTWLCRTFVASRKICGQHLNGLGKCDELDEWYHKMFSISMIMGQWSDAPYISSLISHLKNTASEFHEQLWKSLAIHTFLTRSTILSLSTTVRRWISIAWPGETRWFLHMSRRQPLPFSRLWNR